MLVYDTLVSYDDELNMIPWLAESWAVSGDGLTVNFTIRSGVTWHDGVALDANDVEFTFEYIRDGPSSANGWSFLQHVTSVTAVGSTVTVTLDEAISFAARALAICPTGSHVQFDPGAPLCLNNSFVSITPPRPVT